MVQTNNRFFDEIGRLMNNAAGMTQGVRREIETMMRGQAERMLRELDVVKRDEFEAVKDMARLAREENESLKARVTALEAGRHASAASAGSGEMARAGATGSATSSRPTSSSLGEEGAGLAGSGTGLESTGGGSGVSRGPHLPSGGVEPAGPPKAGPQTPAKPNTSAGDPSI